MTRKRRRQAVSTLLSLSLALLARAALAQDCSQCGQLLCGSSCTFIDPTTGLVAVSSCGSNEFNFCVEPDTTLPCSACPQCPATGTLCLNGSTQTTCPAGPPAFCKPTGSSFVVAPLASSSSQLSTFLDMTGATTGKPSGQSIFYRATDGRVHHIYSNTTWFADDPVAATGAPPAAAGSRVTSFLDFEGLTTGPPAGQSFFYVGNDGHVHHVFSNTTWFADDPSAATGAPSADPAGGLVSFLDPSGVTTGGRAGQAIFYVGLDRHVHHLFSDTTWHVDDPTAGAGAPLAAAGSALCAFLDDGGFTTGTPGQAIFYIGADQHVHHLFSNTTWHTDDPTGMTGAPPAVAGSPLTCFLDPTGKTTGKPAGQSIFYIGTDLHVHHLYSDTTWHTDDPTAFTGAAPALAASPLSSFVDILGVTTGKPSGQSIFYTGTDHHIHHLYSDTTWHTDDPTAMTGAPPAS